MENVITGSVYRGFSATVQFYPLIVFISLCIVFARFSDYNLATGTGNLTVVLFLLANTYIPAKWLKNRFKFKGVAKQFNELLGYHCILNIFGFFSCIIHGYLSHWVNFWLQVTVVLMGFLVVGGFFLRFKFSTKIKKGIYFIHTQQWLFILLLFSLLQGHYFIQGFGLR